MAMTLRLTEEQDAKLTEFAEKSGVSKQQAVARLIETADFAATRARDLDAAYEYVMTHDSELMERLADA